MSLRMTLDMLDKFGTNQIPIANQIIQRTLLTAQKPPTAAGHDFHVGDRTHVGYPPRAMLVCFFLRNDLPSRGWLGQRWRRNVSTLADLDRGLVGKEPEDLATY
jgi:hypothetical protein